SGAGQCDAACTEEPGVGTANAAHGRYVAICGWCEHCDAVAADIGHEEVAGAVQRRACRNVQPSVSAANRAHGRYVAVCAWREHYDAVSVDRHEEVAGAIQHDASCSP